MSITAQIETQITSNPVVLYMKGTRLTPLCGFSAKVVQILNTHLEDYVTVNVLEDEVLRQGIKEFSDWPTIPQLYVGGEFVGGCDIVSEMHGDGSLATLLATVK